MTYSVLLILHFIPDCVKVYQLEVDHKEACILKMANGRHVNGDPPRLAKYASWVLAACDKNKENWEGSNIPEEWMAKDWHTKEIDPASRPKIPASTVIQTGMFC